LGPEADELKFTSNVPSSNSLAILGEFTPLKRVKLPKAIVLLPAKGTTL
jgi:hypothetical protein